MARFILALCGGACLVAASATAACAQYSYHYPPPGYRPPPSAVQPSLAQPSRSEARLAPHLWDVERVRCSDLLRASDADRASAAMFYYGYLAAKTGIRIIDVSRISGNVAKVMRQCETRPDPTVPQAFRGALRPSPRAG